MSVKNRCERTAKRAWIPLVFGLLTTSPVGAAHQPSGVVQAVTPVAQGGQVLRVDGAWDEMMRWLIQRLVEKMNCNPSAIPDDVPVAMLTLVDCYSSGELQGMTLEETAEFLVTIEEATQVANSAPDSIPLLTKEKFLVTIKAMGAEAVVQQ